MINRKRPAKNPITIIRDDRERKPWDTALLGPRFIFKVARLKTGDYTIEGMEKLVCIEKKENWEEMIFNLSRAQNRKNFIRQLRRMQEFPYRALVIQDELRNIPTARTYSEGFNVLSLYRWVVDIQLQYNIPVFAVGQRKDSKELLKYLFEKIYTGNRKGTMSLLPIRKSP